MGPKQIATVFFDITDRKRAEESTHKQSEQLRRLAEVATRLNSAPDVASITGVVTEEARTLVGSHQAVTGFTTDQNWGQAINTVSLSEKYARWRGYDERPDGSGIYSLVCRTNEPLRMTQAELEGHPAYKRFGTHARASPAAAGLARRPAGRAGRAEHRPDPAFRQVRGRVHRRGPSHPRATGADGLRRHRERPARARPAGRPTGARTSSWRRWPTNSATRWPRSATRCKSSKCRGWMRRPSSGHGT